jgi:hypothetical protein
MSPIAQAEANTANCMCFPIVGANMALPRSFIRGVGNSRPPETILWFAPAVACILATLE